MHTFGRNRKAANYAVLKEAWKLILQILMPLLAQILLAFANYMILSPSTLTVDSSIFRWYGMTIFTAVVTTIVMRFGYDKFLPWVLGGGLYWIATMRAVDTYLRFRPPWQPRGPALEIDWGGLNIYVFAILGFIVQFIIWAIIKFVKWRKKKHE